MLRAIIVDDERLAITALEKKLQFFPTIQVIQSFTNINKFLKSYPYLDSDVIFLDIEMQGKNGLQVAKQIKETHPYLMIIFVTAYRDYALQAFDTDGFDYLLKPVTTVRLKKTIERIEQYSDCYKSLKKENLMVHEQLEVFYFNQFKINYKGKWIKWKTAKTRELFAYFLLHPDEPIQRDFLIELLWPYSDINKGKTKLHTTISYLRKSLSEISLDHDIEYYNKCYIFKKINLRYDLTDFIKITDNLQHNQSINISQIERAIDLYGSGFLVQEDFHWATNLQQIYEEPFHKLLNFCIQYYEKTQQEKAIPFYKILIQSISCQEEPVKNYIRLLYKVGHHSEAQNTYDQYKQLLKNELDIEPSFYVTDLCSY